jgi:SAM-dependent methyltransferase
MDNLMEIFNKGMARQYGDPAPIRGPGLNLGAGEKNWPGWRTLGLPGHDFEHGRKFPWKDGFFSSVVAFHLLEHLTAPAIVHVFSEASRVLETGGTFTTVVPHRLGGMAYQDPDHKTFFTEDTWRILFYNGYYERPYDDGEMHAELEPTLNMIMGDSERTLALVSQWKRI